MKPLFTSLLSLALLFSNTSMIQARAITPLTDIGTSAKTIALGGIEGVHKQASVLHENPAAIQRLDKLNFSMFYTLLADQETNYMSGATVFPWKKFRIGLGFTQKSIPNLDYTGSNNNEYFVIDTFEANERLYTVGVSKAIHPHVDIGASGHYYSQNLYSVKGTGANIDLGALFSFDRFTTSIAAKNIFNFSNINYNQGYGSLDFPFQLITSTRYTASDLLTVYGQLKYQQTGNYILKSVGAELTPPGLKDMLKLYLGWKEVELASLLKNRYSMGIGLSLTNLEFQFYYEQTQYSFNQSLYGASITLKI